MSDKTLPIIGVAVKQGDVMIALPAPNRHHHCIRYAVDVLGLTPPIGAGAKNQGFYLADGTYLDRTEAFNHVKRIGQNATQRRIYTCLAKTFGKEQSHD